MRSIYARPINKCTVATFPREKGTRQRLPHHGANLTTYKQQRAEQRGSAPTLGALGMLHNTPVDVNQNRAPIELRLAATHFYLLAGVICPCEGEEFFW